MRVKYYAYGSNMDEAQMKKFGKDYQELLNEKNIKILKTFFWGSCNCPMDLQKALDKAWGLKRGGRIKEALRLYSEAFDSLVQEAIQYSKEFEGSVEDSNDGRIVHPQHFNRARDYLKRDNVAAVISNNMGTILGELGDSGGAKKMFEQAIDLTPDGVEYLDPKMGLRELESRP